MTAIITRRRNNAVTLYEVADESIRERREKVGVDAEMG